MKRFIEGTDRAQSTLFPEYLEDWIDEDNPVRVLRLGPSPSRNFDLNQSVVRSAGPVSPVKAREPLSKPQHQQTGDPP
jgi:hypothetical protein